MKKILFCLLPVFVCLAVLFSIQQREFIFNDFLVFVGSLDFDNSMDTFVIMRDTFSNVGNIWNNFNDSSGIWETIANLGELIVNIIKGLGQLILAVSSFLIESVDNVLQVVGYLLGYNAEGLPGSFPPTGCISPGGVSSSGACPGSGSGGGGGSPW